METDAEQASRADGLAAPGQSSRLAPDHAALLAECYEEIRRTARRLLAADSGRLLIQPTELAHETVIRLLKLERMRFADPAHLLATAARLTRQALIDEARRASRLKRRAPALLTLLPDQPEPVALEDIHRALEELRRISPEHAQIVELRFTLGMTVEEAARAAGLSERTLKRRWSATRAWLQAWLEARPSGG